MADTLDAYFKQIEDQSGIIVKGMDVFSPSKVEPRS
jgi:hypothetical protein